MAGLGDLYLMSADTISRLIGMVVFTIVGARFGSVLAVSQSIRFDRDTSALLFGLVGLLIGVIITPWITTRPVRFLRNLINEEPIEKVLMSLIGLLMGLFVALLMAYPLSLLGQPVGDIAPAVMSIVGGYLGLTMFNVRSKEIVDAFNSRFSRVGARSASSATRNLIVDTSALIDGRIVDVAETGFMGGVLIIPRFVLNELHNVADSSDPIRRGRGRRGLNMLNKLQRSDEVAVRIVEEDFEDIADVDNKLVALSLSMNASLITNDYNLGQVADAQGVSVLNVNLLSNAVRAIYIPGEQFAIRIFQEGTDPDQGVGYLEDGTMVVVEHGKRYMDRTITVEVTKLINRNTGRMIFAKPV